MHIEENFPKGAIGIFTGTQINFVSTDNCFLGIATPAIGQPPGYPFTTVFPAQAGKQLLRLPL